MSLRLSTAEIDALLALLREAEGDGKGQAYYELRATVALANEPRRSLAAWLVPPSSWDCLDQFGRILDEEFALEVAKRLCGRPATMDGAALLWIDALMFRVSPLALRSDGWACGKLICTNAEVVKCRDASPSASGSTDGMNHAAGLALSSSSIGRRSSTEAMLVAAGLATAKSVRMRGGKARRKLALTAKGVRLAFDLLAQAERATDVVQVLASAEAAVEAPSAESLAAIEQSVRL